MMEPYSNHDFGTHNNNYNFVHVNPQRFHLPPPSINQNQPFNVPLVSPYEYMPTNSGQFNGTQNSAPSNLFPCFENNSAKQVETKHNQNMSMTVPFFCTNIDKLDVTKSETNVIPPPPPKPVFNFTHEEVASLASKIEDPHKFKEGMQTLIKWLNDGACTTKDNIDDLFMLINTVHKQVWKLMMEKANEKDILHTAKGNLLQKMTSISTEFAEISVVFEHAKVQKVWDQFTKGQRKGLIQLIKTAEKLKAEIQRIEEVDESESGESHNIEFETDESVKIEEGIKIPPHETLTFENETIFKEAVYLEEYGNTFPHEHILKSHSTSKISSLVKADGSSQSFDIFNAEKLRNQDQVPSSIESDNVQVTVKEVRILTLIGTFLSVHPDGASIDTIFTYIANVFPEFIYMVEVQNLLNKFPKVFYEKEINTSSGLSKNWFFDNASSLESKCIM